MLEEPRTQLSEPGLTRRRIIITGVAAMATGLVSATSLAAEKKKENGTDVVDGKMEMEAEIFFDTHLPNALRRALEYAGRDGFVASLPQLLHARVNASYDNIIWNTWFTSYTEESVVTTPGGTRVVVVVHGGGIYASPERFERSYRGASGERNSPEGIVERGGKISSKEASDILKGDLPDGTRIPIYPFDEFKKGMSNLPRRYGVVLDYDLARKSTSGFVPFEVLRDEPNMIARAGGPRPLAAYLDKAQARHDTKTMGNWHPYQRRGTADVEMEKRINPAQPQTRVIFLAGNQGGVRTEDDDGYRYDYDSAYDIGGDAGIYNQARYVAVAPRYALKSLRNLDFEL